MELEPVSVGVLESYAGAGSAVGLAAGLEAESAPELEADGDAGSEFDFGPVSGLVPAFGEAVVSLPET